MKTLLISLTTVGILFLCSCTKQTYSSNPTIQASIESLLGDSNTYYDGQFTISEARSLATQEASPFYIELSGAFVDKNNGSTVFTNSALSLNNIPIPAQNGWYKMNFTNSQIQTVIGTQVTLSSTNGETNHFSHFSTQFYYPTAIHMNYPNYIPFGTDVNGVLVGTTVNTHDAITWNADGNNTLGVALFVEYNADAAANSDFKNGGFSESVHNYAIVEDNGTYHWDNELLEDIPAGAAIELTIIRGNYIPYILPNDNSKKVKIVATTKESAFFKLGGN